MEIRNSYLSLLPCYWCRDANSFELYDLGVRVKRTPEFSIAAAPTDVVRFLELKVAVGQQAATTD